MMEFRIAGKELLLNYELLTEKCSWSIFDIGGTERCKGILNGKPPHIIPVACLDPALYQLMKDTYQKVADIFKEYFADIPIFITLGNNDCKYHYDAPH